MRRAANPSSQPGARRAEQRWQTAAQAIAGSLGAPEAVRGAVGLTPAKGFAAPSAVRGPEARSSHRTSGIIVVVSGSGTARGDAFLPACPDSGHQGRCERPGRRLRSVQLTQLAEVRCGLHARFLPAWEFSASPRKAFGLIPAPGARAPRASPPARGAGRARPGLAAPRGFRARGARGAPVQPAASPVGGAPRSWWRKGVLPCRLRDATVGAARGRA